MSEKKFNISDRTEIVINEADDIASTEETTISEPKFKVGDMAWSHRCGFRKLGDNGSMYVHKDSYFYRLTHGIWEYTNEGKFDTSYPYPELLTVEEAAKLGYFPRNTTVKIYKYAYISLKSGKWCESRHFYKDDAEFVNRNPNVKKFKQLETSITVKLEE